MRRRVARTGGLPNGTKDCASLSGHLRIPTWTVPGFQTLPCLRRTKRLEAEQAEKASKAQREDDLVMALALSSTTMGGTVGHGDVRTTSSTSEGLRALSNEVSVNLPGTDNGQLVVELLQSSAVEQAEGIQIDIRVLAKRRRS